MLSSCVYIIAQLNISTTLPLWDTSNFCDLFGHHQVLYKYKAMVMLSESKNGPLLPLELLKLLKCYVGL